MIDIQVDTRSALASLGDVQRKQIPFATAVALNRTADDSQAAIRQHIGRTFTLRRKDFIERTIKIENRDRASKTRPFVILGIDPTRNVLAKFELGGPKKPISGKALAVPVNVKRNKRDIITKGNRIRGLNLRRTGDGRISGDKRTFIAGGVVLQRARRGKGTLSAQITRGVVRVLYSFKSSVPLDPDLHFHDHVVKTVARRWQPNFDGALAFALRSAR